MLTNKKINLVISIVAAIAIWVYVTAVINPDTKRTIEGVPVELSGLDALAADGFTVSNDSYAVDVTVSGSRSDLNTLRPEDFKAVANVKGYSIGLNKVDVTVTGPGRATIINIRPERIEINIEEMVSVAKPIRLSYTSEFPSGTEPGFVTLSPHEIDVSGTKTAVSEVAYVTAEIDSSNLTEEESTIIAPAVPSKKNGDTVYDVTLSQNTIDVTATLCHVKEVPFSVELTGELDPGKTITRQDIPTTVSIRGSEKALAAISEVTAQPINISTLEETAIIEPNLNLPDGVELADASRHLTVTIEIGGVEAKEFTFTAEQIEVVGVKDGYTAHVNTGTISVLIFGTADQISKFTADDLKVFVDLEDIDFSLEFVDAVVQFKYKNDLSRIESTPEQVRIIITKIPDVTPTDPVTPGGTDNPDEEDDTSTTTTTGIG
jgi:YbbR domain-containing protein